MASESPGINASQFFVTLGDGPQPHLDKRYQAFGQVLSGMEVRAGATWLSGVSQSHVPGLGLWICCASVWGTSFPGPLLLGARSYMPWRSSGHLRGSLFSGS